MSIQISNKKNEFYDILYEDLELIYNEYIEKHSELRKYIILNKHIYFFNIKIEIDGIEKNIMCAYDKEEGKIKVLDRKYFFISDKKLLKSKVNLDENKNKKMKLTILDEFKRIKKEYNIEFVSFVNVFSNYHLLLRLIVYKNIEKEIKKLKNGII